MLLFLLSIVREKMSIFQRVSTQMRLLYKEMIYQKTAVLIESASEVAAILAKKDREIYKRYGRNLGVAFQMIDDILDIISDSKTLGKPCTKVTFKRRGKIPLPNTNPNLIINEFKNE